MSKGMGCKKNWTNIPGNIQNHNLHVILSSKTFTKWSPNLHTRLHPAPALMQQCTLPIKLPLYLRDIFYLKSNFTKK